jgi:hypothetical protein
LCDGRFAQSRVYTTNHGCHVSAGQTYHEVFTERSRLEATVSEADNHAQGASELAHLDDAEVRQRVRRIFDQLLLTQREILTHHVDRDGSWAVPGDLADYGDGTGLAAIGEHRLLESMRAALDQAEADLRVLHDAVEADKRRRIPGYRPTPPGE